MEQHTSLGSTRPARKPYAGITLQNKTKDQKPDNFTSPKKVGNITYLGSCWGPHKAGLQSESRQGQLFEGFCISSPAVTQHLTRGPPWASCIKVKISIPGWDETPLKTEDRADLLLASPKDVPVSVPTLFSPLIPRYQDCLPSQSSTWHIPQSIP